MTVCLPYLPFGESEAAEAGEVCRMTTDWERGGAMAERGFTLVELMIAVAVLAVLAAIAYPSFTQVIRSNRVATASNEWVAAVSLARSTAVRNTTGAGICASGDGATCGVEWNAGFLLWDDDNGDGTLDNAETVLRFVQGPQEMTVEGPEDPITFDGRGRRRNAADVTLALQPDECGGQELRRTFVINYSGQMRTTRGTCQ